MAGMPWMKWETSKWLADPLLSKCAPTTRGIWADMLCHMHEDGKAGKISGTVIELARMCRCSTTEMEAALEELYQSKTAEIVTQEKNMSQNSNGDVTLRNDQITVMSRRMSREYKSRNSSRDRQKRHRGKKVTPDVTPDVTPE